MDFRNKYLKYKIKYVELKNQIGGKLISPPYRLFAKEYPGLKKAAIERNDKKFIEYGIPDEYIVKFNKFQEDEKESFKDIKNMTPEQKKQKNAEYTNREKEIKENILFEKLAELKKEMTPLDERLLGWVIDSYKEGSTKRIEDISVRLNPRIEDFNLLQKNKKTTIKITDLKGLTGLESYLDQPEIKEELDKLIGKEKEVEEEKEIARKGGDLIYNGKDIKIIRPTTKEGSCYYGQGTRWCTAATESENKFEYYEKFGPMYIIQPKKPERGGKEKYQLHFRSDQYKDESDYPIGLVELYKKYPEIDEIGKIDSVFYRKMLESPGADVEIVKNLVDRGGDLKELFRIDIYIDSIKYILEKGMEKGVNINIKSIYHYKTPLHYAVEISDINIIKYLVENGADINAKDKYEKTPLHTAIERNENNIEIIKYLVEKGADIHTRGEYGKTPLHTAVERNEKNIEIIKYLVEKGADINAKNNAGKTPIDIGIRSRNPEIRAYMRELAKK